MSKRARNREQFPEMAKLVDECRAIFGDGVKLVAGIERGREIGKVDGALRKTARETGAA